MDGGRERRPTHRPGPVVPVPPALAELARYARPRALRWEHPTAVAERRHPAADELEMLMALGTLGVLSTAQIHRRFLGGLSPRGLRHRLWSMAAQGWLRRGHLLCAGPGQTPRICSLTDTGRDLVDARSRVDPFEVAWDDLQQVVHALHVAAWWLAFERTAGGQVAGMRRPAGARQTVPDLVLEMAPRSALACALVAVLRPLLSITALEARLTCSTRGLRARRAPWCSWCCRTSRRRLPWHAPWRPALTALGPTGLSRYGFAAST